MKLAGLHGTGLIADDLYLIAHHEITGRPYLHPRAAGLGLAGGLLAELILSDAIRITGNTIAATRAMMPQDDLGQALLSLVLSERDEQPVRNWLTFLARTATGDVARRLARAGYLTSAASRRPWRAPKWVPVDADCAFAPFIRIRAALDPARPATEANAALAGMAAACGLGPRLLTYAPPGARGRLDEAVRQLGPDLRNLIAQTQAAVDSAVLSQRL